MQNALLELTPHNLEARIVPVVLPAKPVDAAELSEADLEKMAGAGGGLAVSVAVTVVTVALLASVAAGSGALASAGAHSINEHAGW
jgi:hypothetical protein